MVRIVTLSSVFCRSTYVTGIGLPDRIHNIEYVREIAKRNPTRLYSILLPVVSKTRTYYARVGAERRTAGREAERDRANRDADGSIRPGDNRPSSTYPMASKTTILNPASRQASQWFHRRLE